MSAHQSNNSHSRARVTLCLWVWILTCDRVAGLPLLVAEDNGRHAAEVVVSVNCQAGTVVAELLTEPSAKAAALHMFRLKSGGLSDSFAVDPTTGVVTVTDPNRLRVSSRKSTRITIVADVDHSTQDPWLSQFSATVLEAGGSAEQLKPLVDQQRAFEITVHLTRPVELPGDWSSLIRQSPAGRTIAPTDRGEATAASTTMQPSGTNPNDAAHNPNPRETTPSSEPDSSTQLTVADPGTLAAVTESQSDFADPEPNDPPRANQPMPTDNVSPSEPVATTSEVPAASAPPAVSAEPADASASSTILVPITDGGLTTAPGSTSDPVADSNDSAVEQIVETEYTEETATVTEDTNTEVPDSSEIPGHASTLDLAQRAIRMTLISFVPAIAIIVVLFVRHHRRKRVLVEPEEESVPAQSGAENRVKQMLELMRQDESVLGATESGEQSQELDSLDLAVASVVAGTDESTPAAEAARASAAADDRDSIDDFDPESLIPESLLTSITELTPTAQSTAPTQLLTRFDAADSLHYGNARLRASSDTEQDDTTSFDPHGDSDDLQSDCDSILDRLWQTSRTPDVPDSGRAVDSTIDDSAARSALATARREAARSLETHGHFVEQSVEPEFEALDASAGFSMSDGGAATATLERTAVARLTVIPATDNADVMSLNDVESPAFQELPPAECSIAPVVVPPPVPVQDTKSANTKAEETTPDDAASPAHAPEPKHDDLITDYLTGLLSRSRDDKAQQSERRNTTPASYSGSDRRNAAAAVPERKVVKSYIEEYLAKEAEKSAEKSGASLPDVADAIGQSSAVVIAAPRPDRAPVDVNAQRERMESFREMAIESVDHALRTHRVRMAYGSLASRKLMLAALVSMLLLFVLANTAQLIHFGSLNWIMVAIIVLAFSELCLRLQDLQKQKHAARSQRVIASADPNVRATDASELTPFEPADVSASM